MERRLLDEARDARRREREQLITEVSRLAVHLLKFGGEARDARRREHEQLITELSRLAVHVLKFGMLEQLKDTRLCVLGEGKQLITVLFGGELE